MRGANGNSHGATRARADMSGDPMQRTRKAIGSPMSADGIDTVTGTMPRRPLPSPCSDCKKCQTAMPQGDAKPNLPVVVRQREKQRAKGARPPITADNY